MTILGQVFELCNKLAQHGWREMILSVANNELDIKQDYADKLKELLLKTIKKIDRGVSGFRILDLKEIKLKNTAIFPKVYFIMLLPIYILL